MTNAEKFIEIMNQTFDAGFTTENLTAHCSPCGTMKDFDVGCGRFECEGCRRWWEKEYKPPSSEA